MIIPMHKYTMLVYHKEYKSFLNELQELGVLHVVERNIEDTVEIKKKYTEINQLDKTIQFLQNRDNPMKPESAEADASLIMQDIAVKQSELEELTLQLEEKTKEFQKAKPWGNFSPEIIQKLRSENIQVLFYTCNKKNSIKQKLNLINILQWMRVRLTHTILKAITLWR